jgi:PAS domain S-box-containing protein
LNANTERDLLVEQIVDLCLRISKLQKVTEESATAEQPPSIEANLLRTLIDTLPDAIYFKDTESRFVVANESVAKTMGSRSPADLVGKTDFDFYPQELAARYYADERHLVTLGHPIYNQEEPTIDAAGRERWLSTTKVPLRDSDGSIVGIVGIGRDITDKRRAEQELEAYRHSLEEMVAARIVDLAQVNDQLSAEIAERRETEEVLRRYAERLSTLHEIDQTILGLQSPEAIAQAALIRLHRLIPYSSSTVWELQSSQNALRLLAAFDEGSPTRKDEPFTASTSRTLQLEQVDQHLLRDVNYIPDLAQSPRTSALETELISRGNHSYLSVPISSQDEPIGMLLLCATPIDAFSSEHIEIANQVATSLAIAIHQARLHTHTRREAEMRAYLLQEVNRQVKNNLTAVISLLQAELQQADQHSRPYYQHVIGNLAGRLQGLTTVHRMLTAYGWKPLPLNELVVRIARLAIQTSAADRDIAVSVNTSSIRVSPDQALYLALAVNELAANTGKHAHPTPDAPQLQVNVSESEDLITLEFRDNGPGYPDQTMNGIHKAGLQVVKDVVLRDLAGHLEFSNDKGAVTTIQFRPRR